MAFFDDDARLKVEMLVMLVFLFGCSYVLNGTWKTRGMFDFHSGKVAPSGFGFRHVVSVVEIIGLEKHCATLPDAAMRNQSGHESTMSQRIYIGMGHI